LNQRHSEGNNWVGRLTVLLALVGVLGLWLLSPVLMRVLVGPLQDSGLAGDSYGALNALFSGLAFAGVIYAILLQRTELQLQRDELALTRRELARTAEAQEKSEAALGEQAQVMKVSAELNGLSSIIQAYSMQIQAAYSASNIGDRTRSEVIPNLEAKRDGYVEQLELMMHAVQSAREWP